VRNNANHSRRGFTVIELLIICVVIAIIASIALPNMRYSNKAANEASAISSMRAIVAAEETYRLNHTPQQYAVLSQLKTAGLIHPALGSGAKSGYTFITFGIPTAQTYAFISQPQADRGNRYYYVDQTGVIRVNNGDVASPTSHPVD
jgi:type II secretory pathway pseudopilin PulG